jgi:hypothetical protein
LLAGDASQASWIVAWPNGSVPTAIVSSDGVNNASGAGMVTIATVGVQAGDTPARLYAAADAVPAAASVLPLPPVHALPTASNVDLAGELASDGPGDLYELDVSGKTASLAVTLTVPEGATDAPGRLVITDAQGHLVVDEPVPARAGTVTVTLDGLSGPPGATLIVGVLPAPAADSHTVPTPAAPASIPYGLQIMRSQSASGAFGLVPADITVSLGISSAGPYSLVLPTGTIPIVSPIVTPPPPRQSPPPGPVGPPNPLSGLTSSSPGTSSPGQGPARGAVVTPPLPVLGPDAVAGMLAFEGPALPVNAGTAAQVDLALVDLASGRSAPGRLEDPVAAVAPAQGPANRLQTLPVLSVALSLPLGAGAAPILTLPWASADLTDDPAGLAPGGAGREGQEPVVHASLAELPRLAALGMNKATWETEIAATEPGAGRGAERVETASASPARGSLRTTVALAVTSTGAMVMGLLGPDLAAALRTASQARVSRRRLLMPWRAKRKPLEV